MATFHFRGQRKRQSFSLSTSFNTAWRVAPATFSDPRAQQQSWEDDDDDVVFACGDPFSRRGHARFCRHANRIGAANRASAKTFAFLTVDGQQLRRSPSRDLSAPPVTLSFLVVVVVVLSRISLSRSFQLSFAHFHPSCSLLLVLLLLHLLLLLL